MVMVFINKQLWEKNALELIFGDQIIRRNDEKREIP